MSRPDRGERMEKLFELMRYYKADEIDAILTGQDKTKSEMLPVADILKNLYYVEELVWEPAFLSVTFNETGFEGNFGDPLRIPHRIARVHGEPNWKAIRTYNETIMRKQRVLPQDLQLWRWKYREVVINCSSPDENILETFETQVREMNAFWQRGF